MYQVKFKGRKLGATGIMYTIIETIKIDPRADEMAARLELSKKYQDISNIQVIDIHYPDIERNSSNWSGMSSS